MRRCHCEACPYRDRPLVPGYGPEDGLMVVGEAPGWDEANRTGRPFTGRAGKLLQAILTAAGIDPNDVFMTNAVACHPPGNKTPSISMIRSCRNELYREIIRANPEKIMGVGAVSVTALTGASARVPITKVRGRGQTLFIKDQLVYSPEQIGNQCPELMGDPGRAVYFMPTIHPALVLRNPEYFRDLAYDIVKWLENDQPLSFPQPTPVVPETVGEALDILGYLREASVLSCDLETGGRNPHTDPILSLGIGALYNDGSDDGIWLTIPEKLLNSDRLKKAFRDMFTQNWEGMWVFHNLKFDLQFLSHWIGETLRPKNVRDTMLLHYCTDERPGMGAHGLKTLARVHFDLPDFSIDFNEFLAKGPDERDYNRLYAYHAIDLWTTLKLSDLLEAEAREESPQLLKVHDEILIPASIALAEAEYHGALIDREYFTNLRNEYTKQLTVLESCLEGTARSLGMDGCNPRSPKQVSELIYDRLSAPQIRGRTTEKAVLAQIAWSTDDERIKEVIDQVLQHRSISRTVRTFIDGILEKAGSDDRVRTDIWLHGTVTGRLSSHSPNLQNIPVRDGPTIRQGFMAPPGWYFVSIDYAQLELKIAAILSGDERMLEVFRCGEDIHSRVASQVFGKPVDQITPLERRLAKFIDFGIIYGRGARSLSGGWEMQYVVEELGGQPWTREEAENYIERFLAGFPELKKWIEEQHQFVLENKYVETPFGRRRRFPYMSPDTVSDIQRKAVNTPVQSVASDVNTIALSRIQLADLEGVYVLFPVHDEINFEIRGDVLWRRIYDIVEIMESVWDTPIPLRVDVKVDLSQPSRWGRGEEIPRREILRRRDEETHAEFKSRTQPRRVRTEWAEEV